MKDELFNELIASVREGGAILRGETSPSRTLTVDEMDVKRIRAPTRNESHATRAESACKPVRQWREVKSAL